MNRLEELKEIDGPIYSSSRTVPLPPLPSEYGDSPSHLYQIVDRHNQYPPLLRNHSWTLAAPYKEQKEFRSPVDSIANNYTYSVSDIKMRNMKRSRQLGDLTPTKRYNTLYSSFPPPAFPDFHETQIARAAGLVKKQRDKSKKRTESLLNNNRTELASSHVNKASLNTRSSDSSSPEETDYKSRPQSPTVQFERYPQFNRKNFF